MAKKQLALDSINFKNLKKKKSVELKESANNEIAVIGIGTRLPNAKNVDEFWLNIRNGLDCCRELPERRKKDANEYLNYLNSENQKYSYLKSSYLEDVDMFDYSFFGFSPKEANLMNPLQRLFLEVVWETIEDAGYAGNQIQKSNTGLYMGLIGDIDSYKYREMIYNTDPNSLPSSVSGNLASMTPSRISYLLNLKGPSMLIDTACSSSLVAVDMACKALRNGICDMAIASGAKLNLLPLDEECFKFGIESSDSLTRTFDHNADGAGLGEGIVAVMLKPLNRAITDKDNIYAVIKGSAVNQDGKSMGITAPNPSSQEKVIIRAWEDANINPETLSYIEAHGTATKIGDVIEIDGLENAFRKYTNKKQFCAIGSVKSNIGHLYESAGLTGLIKTILMIKNKEIPGTLHMNRSNKKIDFINSPVYINKKIKKIKENDNPIRMGISSFGLSGTNCHVVIEQPPKPQEYNMSEELFIFALSAKSKSALFSQIEKFEIFVNDDTKIGDLCYTLNIGRFHYSYRLAIVVRNIKELKENLQHILAENLDEINRKDIYFDYQKINNRENEYKGKKKIYEEEKRDLDIEANKKVDELHELEKDRELTVREIAKLYTMGADILWENYYCNYSYSRISLPKYSFEPKRCWLDIPQGRKERKESLYYEVVWQKQDFKAKSKNIIDKGIVIIHDSLDIGENISKILAERSGNIIDVRFGDEFTKINDYIYTIDKNEDSYHKLFEHIDKISISHIIHLSSISKKQEIDSLYDLQESQDKGVNSLFYITKAMNKHCGNKRINVVLISKYVNDVVGNEDRINPENATMFGMGKVINQEFQNIRCKAIDIDDNTTVSEIIEEAFCESDNYLSAYRDGNRYEERFCEANFDNVERKPIEIREEGIYIITGGLGKVGFQVAKSLAKKNINLALINRLELPNRHEWELYLKDSSDKKICDRIKAIKEIESLGAHVSYYGVDISDYEKMKSLIAKIRKNFGRINGVIHAAGIPGKGLFISKDKDTFDKVLRPKVQGTWVLHKVTQQDNLDFLVLFSSGISLIGEIGQSDYTAANLYLDSFASYCKKLKEKTLAINWVIWQGARMTEGESINLDGIFKTIPADKGINALYDVLSMDINRIFIGELNYESKFIKNILKIPLKISKELKEKVLKIEIDSNLDSKKQKEHRKEVKLKGKDSGRYSEIEKKLAAIYQSVLGYKEINIYDSFFDMGGDSILLNALNNEIQKTFPEKISVADLFTYTSISRLAKYISCEDNSEEVLIETNIEKVDKDDIAIIGLSAKLPLANDIYEFWHNIRNGIDCIRKIPLNRKHIVDKYIKFIGKKNTHDYMEAGYIDNIDEFDYKFFKLSPKEASLTDPSQRLFMQTIWHAIEDAGYGGDKLYGSDTGVYLGFANIMKDNYQKIINDVDPSLLSGSVVGNTSAMMASRISYLLDLRGPTMVIDTACSSALTAVHTACKAIISGDCKLAIAGGAKLFLTPIDKEHYKIGIEASDGRTRTFDNYSDGAGMGEGVAGIVLKPLSQAIADRDNVYAVIKGSAINQDGASMGITAPNPEAQTQVILKAWKNANIDPETIVHIETHGTGTKLGDPIEIQGITNALRRVTNKKQFCSISSVKSNIGHLNECAGIIGLIKSIMILNTKEIPPTINFNFPNTKIAFNNSPIYVNKKLKKLKPTNEPVRCAVSAFGFSGTNCHMILEEAPVVDMSKDEYDINTFTLSAASEESLKKLIDEYLVYLENNKDVNITELCYSQNTGRGHYEYRLALIVCNYEELITNLTELRNISVKQFSYGENWYYGRHKVILESKEIKQDYSITQTRKTKLDKKAEKQLTKFKKYKNEDTIKNICKHYVEGASIDWDELYKDMDIQKTRVPKYPFECNKLWIDIPENKITNKDEKQFYYGIDWIEQKNDKVQESLEDDVIVVFKGNNSRTEKILTAIKKESKHIIEVSLEEDFVKENDDKYSIGDNQLDYHRLIKEIQHRGVKKIIHTLSMTNSRNIRNINDFNKIQKSGVYSLFYLVKALSNNCNFEDIDLIVLSEQTIMITGNEDELNPENASLYGFSKAINREQTNIKCRAIDIDYITETEIILEEIKKSTSKNIVAYRKDKRYVEMLNSIDMTLEHKEDIQIKEQGIYVITGGTGGIGTEVAKYLALNNNVKLALIGRTKIPERDKWDEILKEQSNKVLCKKIENIKQIESLGAEVKYFNIDISNEEEICSTLEGLRREYGRINGIIHGAGLGGYKTLDEMDEKDITNTLLPKVQGTWILSKLTEKDSLDFFIMFSSVATILYSVGQADYVAANAYLDACADYAKKTSRRVITINWSTWKETGMAFERNFNFDTIFKAIGINDAIEGLDTVLKTRVSRVLIGEINDDSSMIKILHSYPYELSGFLKEKTNKIVNEHKSEANEYVKLEGKTSQGYTALEKEIAQICRIVMGFEEINIYDSFFEMGADSILIKQIHKKLQEYLNKEIAVTDIFQYPTISKLSSFISNNILKEEEVTAYKDVKITNIDTDASINESLTDIIIEFEQGELSVDEVIKNIRNM